MPAGQADEQAAIDGHGPERHDDRVDPAHQRHRGVEHAARGTRRQRREHAQRHALFGPGENGS